MAKIKEVGAFGALEDQVDDLMHNWDGVKFGHPRLRRRPEHLSARRRLRLGRREGASANGFSTLRAQYDQAWIDYQYETPLSIENKAAYEPAPCALPM
jgi:hypothetical protein